MECSRSYSTNDGNMLWAVELNTSNLGLILCSHFFLSMFKVSGLVNGTPSFINRFFDGGTYPIIGIYHWKYPTSKLDFDVSVRHCLLSTHTLKSNSTLGTHFDAMIRTHHFDFDIRFWPIKALMSNTLHQSQIQRWLLSVICVHKDISWV